MLFISATVKRLQTQLVLIPLLALAATVSYPAPSAQPVAPRPFLTYTNCRISSVPWSIHIVQLERGHGGYEVDSVHAGGHAIGLETLSDQLARLAQASGEPMAGINGDFYQRDKAFAGAPRGLQIVHGELISAPSGGASFWIDALGQFHTTNVASLFRITWPDGTISSFGLNGERSATGVELYTPAIGHSTHTTGGRELILTRAEGGRWLPLRVGQDYIARVREIRDAGNTPLTADTLVLSLGAGLAARLPTVQPGALLHITTETTPPLHGVRAAISGGPVLIQDGRRQKMRAEPSAAYEFSSMLERHPRTAVGWNGNYLFLVEVDGRQKALSVGMTLDELSKFLLDLGCEQAMNLDGGGSATLWYTGQVQNSPCDRAEREIANAIVILRKPGPSGTMSAHKE